MYQQTFSKLKRKYHVPVEKYSAKSLLEIFPEAGDHLLQNVHARRTLFSTWPLNNKIILKDLGHRFGMRQRNKLVVLGNVLPIINQHGLHVIRNGYVDHWLAVEGIFLWNC